MIPAQKIRDEGRLINAFGGYDDIENLLNAAANQIEAQQVVIVSLQKVFAMINDVDEVKISDWVQDSLTRHLQQLTKGTLKK